MTVEKIITNEESTIREIIKLGNQIGKAKRELNKAFDMFEKHLKPLKEKYVHDLMLRPGTTI